MVMVRKQSDLSSVSSAQRSAIIFDLGGVLVDWDPAYLYEKLIPDPEFRDWFLASCCSRDWAAEQDEGRSWDAANSALIQRYPEHQALIEAYRGRWLEMLRGGIPESVSLLERLHRRGFPLFALSNWASDTFALSTAQLPFLGLFEGMLISGHVRLRKPDRRIFELLVERFDLEPQTSVFIDDQSVNIATARALGFDTIHYHSPGQLSAELKRRSLLDHTSQSLLSGEAATL